MTTSNPMDIAMQAYLEIEPEITASKLSPVPVLPSLIQVLNGLGPLPEESAFIGLASDGLPMLLDMYDPSPGPLLVIGDPGCGKTSFLKVMALSLAIMHNPDKAQFGVITRYPDDWEGWEDIPNCTGIWPTYERSSVDYILQNASWAQQKGNGKQVSFLFIDGLDTVIQSDYDARQNLRWLVLHGPHRQIWPVATINPGKALQSSHWIGLFRSRIFGKISKSNIANELTLRSDAELETLNVGNQLSMFVGENWLRFWLPELEEQE